MALIEMVLETQGYIPGPPRGKDALWNQATRNDDITVRSWHDQWIQQTKENAESFDMSANSAMLEHGKCAYQPVICAGSGPSLRKNWKTLQADPDQRNHNGRGGIKIVSALHNLGFFEDRDVMGPDDYYCTLDAGDITLSEVTEGGGLHDEDWYWDRTKDRTLIAHHTAYPAMLKKWQGRILWYTNPYAEAEYGKEIGKYVAYDKIPAFNTGGNVLGAAYYFARAILGATMPIFIGADFSFGYDRKFHSWESQYDKKFAGVIPWTDIYGNRVWTWPSYFGFKNWFDHQAIGGSGGNAQMFINATEGGIMGSYAEGNIQQIIQLDLKTVLHMFSGFRMAPELVQKSKDGELHLLF